MKRVLKTYGYLYDFIELKKDVIDMLQKEGNELIIISARGGLIEEMKDVAMKKLEQNEYLKEVSNWGEIYRYIKEIENK